MNNKKYLLIGAIIIAIVGSFLIDAWVREGVNESDKEGVNKTANHAYEVEDLHIYMKDNLLDDLYLFPNSDERLGAFMRIGGEDEAKPVSIRLRGNSSRYLPKKSFNISFDKGKDAFFGRDRIYLNAMYTDPTMMREVLSMEMFHKLGHPAPKVKYFNLYINDVYEGLYLQIERIDQDFLADRYLGKGTLVRDGFRGNMDKEEIDAPSFFSANIYDKSNTKDILINNFSYRGDPDWDKVEEFGKWVYETPAGEEFAKGLMKRIDIDNFIDWYAMHTLVQDLDAYGDDYWLYYNKTKGKGKWMFIPWDKDLSFGSIWRSDEGVANDYFLYNDLWSLNNNIILKVYETESLRLMLNNRIEYLMNNVFTLEYFKERIDFINKTIGPYASMPVSESKFHRSGSNSYGLAENNGLYTETLLDFVELRYEFLNKQLNPVDGESYSSEFIGEGELVSKVVLSDKWGLALAKVEFEKPTSVDYIGLKLEGYNSKGKDRVNRIWDLEYRGEEVEVEITLYYSHGSDQFGHWWNEEGIPLDNMKSLKIVDVSGEKEEELSSTSNPFSNKVSATTLLEGNHRFTLKY